MANYANYIFPTMVDGQGVRSAIFFTGCRFRCKGCYNKKIQKFKTGEPFTEEILDRILDDCSQPYCDGLSILGGEPLEPENRMTVMWLIRLFNERFGPSKTIWLWTGYDYNTLLSWALEPCEEGYDEILYILDNVDIIVDGQFKKDEYSKDLAFRGSKNQRIIRSIDTMQLLRKDIHAELLLWKDGDYK